MFNALVNLPDHRGQPKHHGLLAQKIRMYRAEILFGFRLKAGQIAAQFAQFLADQAQLFQNQIIYRRCHNHPPIAQRAQNPPATSNLAKKATITTQPKDSGRNIFQPMRISWS